MAKHYRLDDETDIQFQDVELTRGELEWLQGTLLTGTSTRSEGEDVAVVERTTLDTQILAEMAFEYEILKGVANTVEIEVIRHFRQSGERTMTTGEISDALDRSKSSVSRALGRLVDKGQLDRVQKGVYRRVR